MSEFPRHLRLSVSCLDLVQMEDDLSFLFRMFRVVCLTGKCRLDIPDAAEKIG